jgi:hypothetical protein
MSVETSPLADVDRDAAHGGGGAGGSVSFGCSCGTGLATTAGSSASWGGGSAGSPASSTATVEVDTSVVDDVELADEVAVDAFDDRIVVEVVVAVETSRAAATDSVASCPDGSLGDTTSATSPTMSRTASHPATIARRRGTATGSRSVSILVGGGRQLRAVQHFEQRVKQPARAETECRRGCPTTTHDGFGNVEIRRSIGIRTDAA